MTTVAFIGERLSFGGRLVGVAQEPTLTVQVDFSSDKPVTPNQFFMLVGAVQEELIPAETTESFMPLTESTFRGVFKIPQELIGDNPIGNVIRVGASADIQGTTFTITGVALLNGAAPAPAPAPASITEVEKKLSTGAMVGIWAAILATGGTVFYLTTRKVEPRRRAAA